MGKTTGRVESWIFTWNNYTVESENCIKGLADCDWIQYVSAGYETGASGTPHLQGYFKCKRGRGKSWRWCNNYFKDKHTFTEDADGNKEYSGAWVREAKADASFNTNYTLKDGNCCVHHGEMPQKGKRNDLQRAADKCEEGVNIRDQVELGFIKNNQALKMAEGLQKYYEPSRVGLTLGIWIYGPSGSGKSRTARALAERLSGEDVYTKNDGTGKWFDGMDGQETIVWNDFRYDTVKPSLFFDMLDEGPLRVEVKGHTRQFRAKYVIFTSEKNVSATFEKVYEEELYQFERRCPVDLKLKKNRLTKAHIESNVERLFDMILEKECEIEESQE